MQLLNAPELPAQQLPTKEVEEWFLAIATAPRLYSWRIPQAELKETISSLTPEINAHHFDRSVRTRYGLGLLVLLPDFENTLTEIHLLENEALEEPGYDDAGARLREKFKIDKTYNFYLPEFKDGQFPTKSELYENLEIASSELKYGDRYFFVW